MARTKDLLFLLETPFFDPAYPGEAFFCREGLLLEGALAAMPTLADAIEVRRVAFPRPRGQAAALLGPDNQSMPTLILADDAPAGLETGAHNGTRFVKDADAILRVLAARHGVPTDHP